MKAKLKKNLNSTKIKYKKIFTYIPGIINFMAAVSLAITANKLSSKSLLYSSQFEEPLVEVKINSLLDNLWYEEHELKNMSHSENSTIFEYHHKTTELFTIDYVTFTWITPIIFHDNDDKIYAMDRVVSNTHLSALRGHTQGSTSPIYERKMLNRAGSLELLYFDDSNNLVEPYNALKDFKVRLSQEGLTENILMNNYFVAQIYYHDNYSNNGTLNYIYQTVYGGGPNLLMKVSIEELEDYMKFVNSGGYTQVLDIDYYLENSKILDNIDQITGTTYSHYGFYDLPK